MRNERWKGFTDPELGSFGASRTAAGVEMPYWTRGGAYWRTKLFPASGNPPSRWLGRSRPQIPYGLWRFPRGGEMAFLCEGESDTLAFALAFPEVPVLGIPGASSWKSQWASLFTDFRRVYLSFDGDPAGDGRPLPDKRAVPYPQSLAGRVKADLPRARTLMLPDHADTRDILQLLGRDAYQVLVTAAARWAEEDEAREARAQAFRHRNQVEMAYAELRPR